MYNVYVIEHHMEDRIMKSELFKELNTKSVVQQIVDRIVDAIINGELKPGDKIPTEMELCKQLNVGRNSVREAIKILVAYGVLTIKRAEGTFVVKEYNSKMIYPVLYGIILQENATNQVIELRKIIDDGILHLAMDKMPDTSLIKKAKQVLVELRKRIKENGVRVEDFYDADIQFHDVLVDITENNLLKGIGSYVNLITKKTRLEAIEKFIENNEIEKFFELHEDLLTILEHKEKNKIDEAIKEHYVYWSTVK